MLIELSKYAACRGVSQAGDYARTRVMFLLFAGISGSAFYVTLGPVIAMSLALVFGPYGAMLARAKGRVKRLMQFNLLLGALSLALSVLAAFSPTKGQWIAGIVLHSAALGIIQAFVTPAESLLTLNLSKNAKHREAANGRTTIIAWAMRALILGLFATLAYSFGSVHRGSGPMLVSAALVFDAVTFFMFAMYLRDKHEESTDSGFEGQALTLWEKWRKGWAILVQDRGVLSFLILQTLIATFLYSSGAITIAFLTHEAKVPEWKILGLFAVAAVAGALFARYLRTSISAIWVCAMLGIASLVPTACAPGSVILVSGIIVGSACAAGLVKMSDHVLQGLPRPTDVRSAWLVFSIGLGNVLTAATHACIATGVVSNRRMMVITAISGLISMLILWRLCGREINLAVSRAAEKAFGS